MSSFVTENSNRKPVIGVHTFLKSLNAILRLVTVLLIVLVLLFAGFMIWDNTQVYTQAENVRLMMQEIKEQALSDDNTLSFDELRKINPDVVGWLTIGGTQIDYPIVRGENNFYYLNRDVFGESSLAGALYMDSRNSPDFSDIYTIIYGHHMENHLMFGDLDLFKDKEFFEKNQTGSILLPDGVKDLHVLAIMEVNDNVKEVFDPTIYDWEISGLCVYLQKNAMHLSQETLDAIMAAPDQYQVVALITCTSGATGNRTALFLTTEYGNPHKPTDDPDAKPLYESYTEQPAKPIPKTGDSTHTVLWLILLLLSLSGLLLTFLYARKK